MKVRLLQATLFLILGLGVLFIITGCAGLSDYLWIGGPPWSDKNLAMVDLIINVPRETSGLANNTFAQDVRPSTSRGCVRIVNGDPEIFQGLVDCRNVDPSSGDIVFSFTLPVGSGYKFEVILVNILECFPGDQCNNTNYKILTAGVLTNIEIQEGNNLFTIEARKFDFDFPEHSQTFEKGSTITLNFSMFGPDLNLSQPRGFVGERFDQDYIRNLSEYISASLIKDSPGAWHGNMSFSIPNDAPDKMYYRFIFLAQDFNNNGERYWVLGPSIELENTNEWPFFFTASIPQEGNVQIIVR